MKTRISIFFYVLPWLLLLICISVLIFCKQINIPDFDKNKQLQDSILLLEKELDILHHRQDSINKINDSLTNLEPTIKHVNRTKIQFIYTDADINDLDSIVRKWSKRKARYY